MGNTSTSVPNYTKTEYNKICNVIRVGNYGSFTYALGELLSKADDENAKKLASIYPKEFAAYLERYPQLFPRG